MDHQPPRKRHKALNAAGPAGGSKHERPCPPPEVPAAVPRLQQLLKVPCGLDGDLSPGAMHGSRVLAFAAPEAPGFAAAALFANGSRLYMAGLQAAQEAGSSSLSLGKDGILIPRALPAPPAQELQQLTHRAEVQSLASRPLQDGTVMLATVDACGRGHVARMPHPVHQLRGEQQPELQLSAVQSLTPPGPPREAGWAGVCISDAATPLVAAARAFARDVTVYDAAAGSPVRRFGLSLQPYALTFLPAQHGSLLAVAENHVVSIWDARAGEQGGCVQRTSIASLGHPLYGMEWCPSGAGLLGVAGSERSIYFIDPRKWRTQHKWAGVARQALHSLCFLEADPRFCCCWGLDFEVLCARWDKPSGLATNARPFQTNAEEDGVLAAALPADRPGFSFRGDSRWLGVAKAAGADVLAGLGASGNLVYAKVIDARTDSMAKQ